MLDTIESLLFNSNNEVAGAKQSGGGIAVKRVQSENYHDEGFLTDGDRDG
jgi:hypothetical protein